MVCNKDTRKCHSYRDDSYSSCDGYEDRGKNQCRGWSKWFSWLCFGWFWVANVVCTGYSWIANVVCSGWVIVVEYYACGVINSVLNFVCNATSSVTANPQNRKFNLSMAYDTVRLSKWVYDGQAGIQANLGTETPITHLTDLRDGVTETEGTICFMKNDIYLTFRGTESDVKDWLSDASAFPTSFHSKSMCGSKAHLGFVDGYLSLEKKIEAALTNLVNLYPNARIITSGHSLGGSLATVAAFDLQKKFPTKDVIMYNYGSPSVGNTDFVEVFNQIIKESWRVHDPNDPIPLSSPFTHVKKAYFLKIDSLINIKDHSIDRYEAQIKTLFMKLPPPVKSTPPDIPEPEVLEPVKPLTILIGNRSQKELHKPGCTYIDQIAKKNRFEINSSEAQKYYDEMDYDGCYYCNRKKHWK